MLNFLLGRNLAFTARITWKYCGWSDRFDVAATVAVLAMSYAWSIVTILELIFKG